MKRNPQRRTALIWVAITLVSVAAIFAPHIIGMDGMNGGFAISFGAIVLAITGIIVTIVYFRRAHTVDNMVKGKNLLAHWTYTAEEWQEYVEEEFAREKAQKRKLFITIAIISVIVGIVLYAVMPDHPKFFLFASLGLIALIGIVAYLSVLFSPFRKKTGSGEVYISGDGVYLARQLHTWEGLGARLENAGYDESSSRASLSFEYSTPGRDTRSYYSVRVPIPLGKEEEARTILEDIRTNHRS